VEKARNDLSAAVPKFCLALEEHRRTPDGRVRTSQEFLASFFPHDEKTCTDRLFKYLPNEVRGPIVAAWGIRGIKAALRDTDDKVQSVVHDAVVAGDVDHQAFEDGMTAETLVRWIPLGDLWSFWRGGKLTKQAIHKALSTAFDLYLFDARWFLDTLQGKGGSIKGTDVLADGLSKDDLTAWVRRIHETGDGTPKGLVAALGWDKIVSKTANDQLVGVLDAMVTKVGLVVAASKDGAKVESTPKVDSKAEPAVAAPVPAIEVPADASAEKPVGEDSWSMPPGSPPAASADETGPQAAMSTEEAINVVLEDEVLFNDPPTPSKSAVVEAKPHPQESRPPRDRPQWRPGGKR